LPFSPIADKAREENLAMMTKASLVVLTAVPFGYGNLVNLEAVKESLKRGIPTYVIDEVPIDLRDFTQGKAKALFAELKQMKAVFVKNQVELLHLLQVSEEKLKMANGTAASVADHLKPKTTTENKASEIGKSKSKEEFT